MVKRLLIDATHAEEIRVAVVNGSTLEEFDSETSNKRLIKSNIYLAKVIRVEPSLQAAFVEYSGGRHGFLPFAEIHPDYYRIPVGDRMESAQDSFADADEDADEMDASSSAQEEVLAQDETATDLERSTSFDSESEQSAESSLEAESEAKSSQNDGEKIHSVDFRVNDEEEPSFTADASQDEFYSLGGDDVIYADEADEQSVDAPSEAAAVEKKRLRYRYKIQEVIKRRQILLVQVVKEERGNKGAALTTYLSLPGRYCVLMPNAGHRAGGISRKISDGEDRRRLRELMKEFEVPAGMSLIVRTAGQERNRSEIKRDYEYLLRVWDDIREKTLQSIAPTLVYAEGDLVKRAIRDIYDRDVEEILVEGEEAYKAAKHFMRSLIPSHAKKVRLYKDLLQPIFHRFNVETQIEKMHAPVQALPSGGSIVINHTEALVAIDVNSGKSTRERHIDDTAFKTNMEAAAEVAKQLRLRDIGGLVVVDFIDMQDSAHIAQVERKMRDVLKTDRARIQIGRISQFGLLEMSRQRLRPSLLESHSITCSHCKGTGVVRSVDSLALQILREIERVSIMGTAYELLIRVPSGVDLYLLNQKRMAMVHIESRFDVRITVERDDALMSPDFVLTTITERTKTIKIIAESDGQPVITPRSVSRVEEEAFSVDESESDEDSSVIRRNRRNNNRRNRSNRNRSDRIEADTNVSSPGDTTGMTERFSENDISSAKASFNTQEGGEIVGIDVESSDTPANGSTPVEGQSYDRGMNRRRRHPYQRRSHMRYRDENSTRDTAPDANRTVKAEGESGDGKFTVDPAAADNRDVAHAGENRSHRPRRDRNQGEAAAEAFSAPVPTAMNVGAGVDRGVQPIAMEKHPARVAKREKATQRTSKKPRLGAESDDSSEPVPFVMPSLHSTKQQVNILNEESSSNEKSKSKNWLRRLLE